MMLYEIIFKEIVDKVVQDESAHLNDWDLVCKGSVAERKKYWTNNQMECIHHYYSYNGLHSSNWQSEEHMYIDVGYVPLYADVIKLIEGGWEV